MPTLKQYLVIVFVVGIVSFMLQNSYWLPFYSDQVNIPSPYLVPDSVANVYHSEEFFLLNYEAMKKNFKVFVYPEGNPRKCYDSNDTKLKTNYASEHYFFMNLRDSPFFTQNPHEAHLFFIPFSCQQMVEYKGNSPRYKEVLIQNYVESIMVKFPYWNRTLGADHFFVSCHGIGNRATVAFPFLLKNAIRLVCSPSYDDSTYIPHKDVSLPQILELSIPPEEDDMWNKTDKDSNPILLSPKMANPPRTKIGFWAGSPNSELRRQLGSYYHGVEGFDFHFVQKVQRAAVLDTFKHIIYRTKYCICPRGKTQVGGVCLTESMAFGCVPVIMSDYYDLPFNDILDWNAFSVILKEDDVPMMGKVLQGIPEETYKKMHRNLLKVRQYFKWHSRPVQFDEFHMVMYELWKRRHVIRY